MTGKSSEPPEIEVDFEEENEGDRVSRHPTKPPPFDPVEFARRSESLLAPRVPAPEVRKARPAPSDPMIETVATDASAEEALAALSTRRPPAPLEAVPCRAVHDEDLEWFELPESLLELYAAIDGESTLEAIAGRLSVNETELMGRFSRLVELGVAEIRGMR